MLMCITSYNLPDSPITRDVDSVGINSCLTQSLAFYSKYKPLLLINLPVK